jgi:broad specificity phosphatase PhoE
MRPACRLKLSSAANPEVSTLFHLVRHASYDLLGRVLAGRTPGLWLNEQGRAEGQRLGVALANQQLAAVVSSPRERCAETAAAIATPHGIPVLIDEGFDEVKFGSWTGKEFASLGSDPAWRRFNINRGLAPVPGGEGMLEVQARAVTALVRWRAAHGGGEVVIVSHADVLKSVLAHVLGMPLDLMRRLEISPAGRCVLEMDDTDAVVRAFNLPP